MLGHSPVIELGLEFFIVYKTLRARVLLYLQRDDCSLKLAPGVSAQKSLLCPTYLTHSLGW